MTVLLRVLAVVALLSTGCPESPPANEVDRGDTVASGVENGGLLHESPERVDTTAAADHSAHDASRHDAHGDHSSHGKHRDRSAATAPKPIALTEIPEVSLISHRGATVNFHADLLKDKVVALNFIFTSCATICPPQGALFARMQGMAKERGLEDVAFISVSIDPVTDTPERLAAWADKFGGSPDWTLLTGDKASIDGLLKKLGVFSALREDHAPVMLLGNEATGAWQRAYGLAPPELLLDTLVELSGGDSRAGEKASPGPGAGGGDADAGPGAGTEASREWFTNTPIVDHTGTAYRFYDDLVAGRTVVIHAFFAHCEGSCPPTLATVAQIQSEFRSHLGDDLRILSITLDPEADTPKSLAKLADDLGVRSGWHLLTGDIANVKQILTRLGQWTDNKEAHQSMFLVGNERTGLWKKVFGLGPVAEVIPLVRSVLEDEG